jgi:hypothetical protein
LEQPLNPAVSAAAPINTSVTLELDFLMRFNISRLSKCDKTLS